MVPKERSGWKNCVRLTTVPRVQEVATAVLLLPYWHFRPNNGRRQKWIIVINRKFEDGKNWEPNNDARLCSEHFPDGRPTEENPDPSIALGYMYVSKQKNSRKATKVKTPTDAPVPMKKARMDLQQSASSSHVLILKTNQTYMYMNISHQKLQKLAL